MRRTFGGTVRAGRALLALILTVAVLPGLSACTVDVVSPDPHATSPSGPPPSYLDKLKAAPVAPGTTEPDTAPSEAGGGAAAFVNSGHNVVCVLTTSRGGRLNTPLEPNNFDDRDNQSQPLVPVVQCQLSAYPEPATKDVKDDCSGTHLGYLGGVVLLAVDTVAYGNCRAGVTAMEAEYGPKGQPTGPISALPVREDGKAVDKHGYRCAPLDGGVACANLSNGVGFFVSKDSYQLFGAKK